VQALQQPTRTEDGQHASALPFAQPRTMALWAALVYHGQRPTTFRNPPLEQAELDAYQHIDHLMILLKAHARAALGALN
jgi:hypothetical protein